MNTKLINHGVDQQVSIIRTIKTISFNKIYDPSNKNQVNRPQSKQVFPLIKPSRSNKHINPDNKTN